MVEGLWFSSSTPRTTPRGVPREVCAFRDGYEEFGRHDAEVIGVSSDSVSSHKNLADNHDLPFTLLSDAEGKVRRLYGVPSTFGLFPGRVTYIIDGEGVVRYVFSSQLAATRHVREALGTLRTIG